MNQPGVSVVICSYNGGRLLPKTIECLAKQEFESDITWEIIFVDNASTDGSTDIVRTEWGKYNCKAELRLLQQSIPGKKYAQDLGFKEAKFDTLLVVDDDNWLYSDYIEKGYKIMKANPKIGALGGLNLLECECEVPEWFESVQSSYAVGPQAIENGKIPLYKYPKLFGAGMFINNIALTKLKSEGFQSLLTCRKGEKLTSGGDDELCYALSLSGFEIWYNENLKLYHFMPKDRLTWAYYLRFFKDNGKGFVLLGIYQNFITNKINEQPIRGYIFRLFSVFYFTLKSVKLSFPLKKEGSANAKFFIRYYSCLKYLMKNRKEYNEAIDAIKKFIQQGNKP